MYNHNGQQLFVIDGHMHFWDANPQNWAEQIRGELDQVLLRLSQRSQPYGGGMVIRQILSIRRRAAGR
jgi:hypothetical protein